MCVEVGEHVVPHGRDGARDGGPAGLDEPHERLGLEETVGHAERGAGHDRGVGQSPGVGMEHRDDRQHPVVEVEAGGVAGAHGQRVQPGRPVAVDHALGVAGGATRVAHGGRVTLVDLGPVEGVRLAGDQVVVQHDLLAGGAEGVEVRRGGVGTGHQDVGDGLELRQLLGEQRDERVVDDDDAVLGVVGDVDELVGEEPDVERVEHRSHRRDREVGLEVLGVVPHEGRDPLVAVDPESAQRVRELRRTPADVGVRAPTGAAGGRGDHLGVGVDRACRASAPSRS